MEKFIKSNKKLLFTFLFFLFLAFASDLYLKTGVINDKNPQTAVIDNQDFPKQQTQQPASSASQKSAADNKNPASAQSTENVVPTPETGQKYAFYIGEKKYEIAVSENSTVYDLMNSLKQRGDINFNGKTSAGLGFFVEEINGQKNNTNTNTYWIYYINGEAAGVGISNYILKPGDIISWKYEKPQF